MRIVYHTEAGGVAVIIPAESIEAAMKDIPEGTSYKIMDVSDIPAERDFRGAWELNGETVSVNIDKAKAITKDRLRAERAPLLQAQDVLYMKALEQGQDTVAIVAEKQRLRDITNLADACTTTAELRALSVQGA